MDSPEGEPELKKPAGLTCRFFCAIKLFYVV